MHGCSHQSSQVGATGYRETRRVGGHVPKNLFFQGASAIPAKPSSMEQRWCFCGEFPLLSSLLFSSMLVCASAACERPMRSEPDLALRSSQASMRLRGGSTSWSDSPATSRLRDLAKSPYDLTQNDAITPGRISTMQVCPNASHRLAHRSSVALSVSTSLGTFRFVLTRENSWMMGEPLSL